MIHEGRIQQVSFGALLGSNNEANIQSQTQSSSLSETFQAFNQQNFVQ